MKTTIIGIGGAGCNIVDVIRKKSYGESLNPISWIYADSIESNLSEHGFNYDHKVLLTSVFSGFKLGLDSEDNRLIVIVGLGGNTGNSYARNIILTAKTFYGLKDITVVCTLPFEFEGAKKRENALETVRSLLAIHDVEVVVVDNQEIMLTNPEINFVNAFDSIDTAVVEKVKILISNPVSKSSKVSHTGGNPRLVRFLETDDQLNPADFLPAESIDVHRPVTYFFSTEKRFHGLQTDLDDLAAEFQIIEVYLFGASKASETKMTVENENGLCSLKVVKVATSFLPPDISGEDKLLDFITLDPELQPLTGGFLALKRFIDLSPAQTIEL